MKQFLTVLSLTLTSYYAFPQSMGPNGVTAAVNTAGVGTLAWLNPDRIYTSNNMYSTEATRGATNYLVGTGCGFTIPVPSAIDGIQVEIERSTNAYTNIAVNDGWTQGTTKTISAGTNRYLIVVYSNENGLGERDLTGLTWGGQPMTQLAETEAGTLGAFMGRVEIWGLNEAGIAAGTGTALVATYGGFTALDYCELFTAAVYNNVDQLQAVTSNIIGGASAATNPHQLPTAFTPLTGGVSINAVGCGNVGTYTINSGYTEVIDAQFASGTGSGATLQVAHELNTTANNQPSCTFSATVNRWFMVGIHLQRARNVDNQVRIVKAGAVTGNNLAFTNTAWPTADAYAVYGGSTNLWGTTWVEADINSPNFGAALSTIVQNGTVQVDHFRITVWYHSTLPIELLDFTAEKNENAVDLNWATATETNNDYFIVQRSKDGITYEDLETIDGAGNSVSLLYYGIHDEHPYTGTSYYRLKQVDFNGAFEYSPVRAVTFDETSVLVYPNPVTTGNITIFNNHLEINEIAVYSAEMKLVKTTTYYEQTNPVINIEDVADGTYFLVIKLAHETKVVKAVKSSVTR